MYRTSKLLIAFLALALCVPAQGGPERDLPGAENSKKVRELMHKKLDNAQKLLEGIATNNFDKISQHADELMVISKSLHWNVIKTPRYELHSNQFRRTLEDLLERAKEKNLDGAALSYVDLTLTCVKCHKYVRENRMTALPKSGRDF